MSDVVDWVEDKVVDPVVDVVEDVVEDITEDPLNLFLPYYITKETTDFFMDLATPDIPPNPGTGDIAQKSPTYANTSRTIVPNTANEGTPVALIFGRCKTGGNLLRFGNDTSVAHTLHYIISHGLGELNSVVLLKINDIAWDDLKLTDDSTKHSRFFPGNRTQDIYDGGATAVYFPPAVYDKVCNFRSFAFHALKFSTGEEGFNEVGYNPNVTVILEGLKVPPLAGGSNAFTRNPAVITHYIYTDIEDYDAGDIDTTTFQSLEGYCDAVPPAGSLPRYRFDYVFDADVSVTDAKKLIWSSFFGKVIQSQGKWKPVWDGDQMPDGSGGLTARTSQHSFTMDNIVMGSLSFSVPDRYNVVRIHYLDSDTDNSYQKTTAEAKDESDIEINGEIAFEETCYFIVNGEIARRRAERLKREFQLVDYNCSLTGFSDASHLEEYDKVEVTHVIPGWSSKPFIITEKSEDALGRPTFKMKAYHAGVYSDSEAVQQENFGQSLPNPYVPESVVDVSLSEGGFIADDGSYVPYVDMTFTPPNTPFWRRGLVYVATDNTLNSNYDLYGTTATGNGYRIEAAAGNFAAGDTLYVKVLSENNNGASQILTDVTAVSEYIDGKNALPSNVTGFAVSQIGNVVLFTMDRPDHATDADFSHFEIRKGSSWALSELITKCTHTKFLLSDFTEGEKTFWIKAVDTSGNKSSAATSTTITLDTPDTQNIYKQDERIQRIGAANTATQLHRDYNFYDLGGGFSIAATARMDDDATARMDDNATTRMWAPAYDTGTFVSESIDISTEVTGKIFCEITTTGYDGTSYTIEYATSTDDVSFTDWAGFVNGVAGTFRYVRFRIVLSTDRTNYPQSNIKVLGMYASFDLPTIKNRGNDVTIASGGTTITFDNPYTLASMMRVKTAASGSSALLVTWENKTTTQITFHVWNTAGSDVGGTIDYEVEGY